MQHMGGGVEACRFIGVVRKTAFELLFCALTGEFLMFFKSFLIAFHIHREALFGSHFHRQFDGEAVGLVQIESIFAGNDFAFDVRRNTGDEFFKFPGAAIEGRGELAFFTLKFFQNDLFVDGKFGIDIFVVVDDHLRHSNSETLVQFQFHRFADSTADDAAQDICLVHFARRDAVAHDECGSTHMFHNDPFGTGAFCGCFNAPELIQFGEEGRKDFGIVAAGFALQDGGDAFHPHTGIHVLLFQRFKLAFCILEVLHENVVPDFDPALVGGIEDFRRGLGTGPVEDLGVRTAGTGFAGRTPPVVFLGQFCDTFFADAVLAPFVEGFFVEGSIFITGKDSECQTVQRDVQPAFVGQEVEAVADGFHFEVVAQRPVAQHFKEGQMHRISHFLNVAGPDTFLVVGQTGAEGMFFTEEVRHEGVHTGSGEKNGRVVIGNQRSAFDFSVSVFFEELDVFCA